MSTGQLRPGPFYGSWIKFVRAARHRYTLETNINKALDPKLDPLTVKSKVERNQPPYGTLLFSADHVPELTHQFGATIGDVVHNLRSSLDLLTWQLVRRGAQPRPKKPKRVQFPLATSGGSFNAQIPERLPGVPLRPHVALIRRFQPYRRDMRGKGMLALRSLNDTDKHRILIPTVMAAKSAQIGFSGTNCVITKAKLLLPSTGSLKSGTPIARVSVRYGPGEHKVHMKGNLELEPTLGRGRPLSDLLRHIEAVVFEVLDSFDRLVQGSRYEPTIPELSVDRGGEDDPLRGLASTENDQV